MSRSRRDSPRGAPPSAEAPGSRGPIEDLSSEPERAASAAPSSDAGGGPTSGPLTLGSTGAVYVTHAAALALMGGLGYGGDVDVGEARRRLLALATDARPVDREVSPERWRSRRSSHGIEVSLAVVREQPVESLPPIAVVVGCTARPYRGGGGRRRRS